MALRVIERQETEQWYELHGDVKAAEMFPTLLAGNKDVYETEEFEEEHPEQELCTESEKVDGHYDGCPQELDAMRDEVDAVMAAARPRFWAAAIEAATNLIQAGKPILWEPLNDEEIEALEEAAKALNTAIPWDAAEAEMLAARKAEQEAWAAKWRAEEEAKAAKKAEELRRAEEAKPEIEKLFRAGATHTEMRAKFPDIPQEWLARLVGDLRGQGVLIRAK